MNYCQCDYPHMKILVFSLQTDQQILHDLWQILSKVQLSSFWFTWFCKPLYNSLQWAMPNPQSLREKVNSADNTVSSTGCMWQEVYTTACLAKRIIFSSRATELMLFHSHPGSAYWPVKLPCCGLREHSVNPAYLFIPATPTRLWFNHWLLCGCQTVAG